MPGGAILFVSWQAGLGHVRRDLPIVTALRRHDPDVRVSWLAHPLACRVLREAGEALLPEADLSADYNEAGVRAVDGFRVNVLDYVRWTREARDRNVALFRDVLGRYHFDLVVGDESYEIADALRTGEVELRCRMIMIEDFVGVDAMSRSPLERVGAYLRNRRRVWPPALDGRLIHCFVGEVEDVPDRRFGLLLPNRREYARHHYHFLGHILRFDPSDYADTARTRRKLGYGQEPLLVCATGGTAAGKELLALCGEAYTIVRKDNPDLRMLAVCGELYGMDPPALPAGVELRGYVPDIHEHYAACDVAVVVGGGTTTTELIALRRPFVFFPLEGHFDQELNVAGRLARLGAGTMLRYSRTTPESLAGIIRDHIGQDVRWTPIPMDGGEKAATLIEGCLAGGDVLS